MPPGRSQRLWRMRKLRQSGCIFVRLPIGLGVVDVTGTLRETHCQRPTGQGCGQWGARGRLLGRIVDGHRRFYCRRFCPPSALSIDCTDDIAHTVSSPHATVRRLRRRRYTTPRAPAPPHLQHE